MTWRHDLYPNYKKKKPRIDPKDIAPEEEYKKINEEAEEELDKIDAEEADRTPIGGWNPVEIIQEVFGEHGSFYDKTRREFIEGTAQTTDKLVTGGLKKLNVPGAEFIGDRARNITGFVSDVAIPEKEEAALLAAAVPFALAEPTPFGEAAVGLKYGHGVASRIYQGGSKALSGMVDKVFNLKSYGRKYVDPTTGATIDPQDATYFMSKGISKGDGYSYRKGRPLKNPIWDNLAPKVQKGFTDANIDSDKAKFFIEEWTREVGANVEGFPFTDSTFNFMKGELLPKILEDMKGIDLSDGLQLDHIAQLKAMAPFYQGRNLKQAEKIRRILIKEGIFGGHNPKNLKYLPTDVHTVKTNFWKQNVGDAGEKFFEGRPMKTYADVEKAAKEMKLFINRSNKIVETVSAQYKFMRKKKISAEELDKILKKVDLNYGTYNLKEVRKLIKEEINVDTLSKSKKNLDDLDKAIEAQTIQDNPLPYRYEDEAPLTIKRTRKKKSTLQKMAEEAKNKEEKRLKKLGGQTELPLDE